MKRVLRLLIIAGALAILFFVGCPFYEGLGIPCPGCGLTRAWLSLFKGDVQQAFSYNMLFIPLTIVVLIIGGTMLVNKALPKWLNMVALSITAVAFLYNVARVVLVMTR